MKIKLIAHVFIMFFGVQAAWAASTQPIQGGQDLTGTWRVFATIPNTAPVCAPSPVDCEYQAMSTATSDGTLVQTAEIPLTSTGHGVWKRTGKRTFSASALYFRSNLAGQPIGTSTSQISVELDQSGLVGNGTFFATLDDLDGNPTGISYQGTVVFERFE